MKTSCSNRLRELERKGNKIIEIQNKLFFHLRSKTGEEDRNVQQSLQQTQRLLSLHHTNILLKISEPPPAATATATATSPQPASQEDPHKPQFLLEHSEQYNNIGSFGQ